MTALGGDGGDEGGRDGTVTTPHPLGGPGLVGVPPGPWGFPPVWRLMKGPPSQPVVSVPPPCPGMSGGSGRQLLAPFVCREEVRGRRGLHRAWGTRPPGCSGPAVPGPTGTHRRSQDH